jgi:predicted esterase
MYGQLEHQVMLSCEPSGAPAGSVIIMHGSGQPYDGTNFTERCMFYQSRGFLAISIEYRLGQPEFADDVRRAISWMRTNHPDLTICLTGFSWGGGAASFVGLTDPRVACVVTESGWASAATLAEAGPDAPPFYIVHGTVDPLVPITQAETLRDVLTAAGVSVTWVPHDGGHESVFASGGDAMADWMRGV